MFFTKDRGVIPRVDSAFKDIPNAIKATQVAQIDINNFEVRIIPDRSTYKDDYSKKLINNLHEYLGSSVNIHIKIVEEIKRTKGGKLRAMVNESKEVKNSILNLWNKHN
jgi:phenylacetate-coenzyme A ligase PaaK-like adenylate-forming protein